MVYGGTSFVFPISHRSLAGLYFANHDGNIRCNPKNTEKTALARKVAKETAGMEIGKYHIWTSVGAALAIILTGYMVDFITIGSIFYLASLLYLISGIILLKKH